MSRKKAWIVILVLLVLAISILTLTSCDSETLGKKAGDEANKFCEGFCGATAMIPGAAAFAAIMRRKGNNIDE